ncbi:MAG: SCO family protein [Mycobacteriales bacterium]
MPGRRRFLAALAVCLASAGLAACSGAPGAGDSAASAALSTGGAHRFPTPHARPSFTLTDTAGAAYHFGTRTGGHPTFLYFGYTRCPDVCPATMAELGAALRAASADAKRDARVVFVTTNPSHDTPAVIRRWLGNFDRGLPVRFIGLTGSRAQLTAAQVLAGVPVADDNGQTHSAATSFYGYDDVARVFYLPGDTPATITAGVDAAADTKGK